MRRPNFRRSANRGGVSGGIVSPATIFGPNLIAWYRADRLITLNGGTVSAWGDSSGRGDANQNLAQAAGANQFIYNASNAGYGGQPTLDGNGTSMFMTSGTWATPCTRTTTIFVVGNSAGAAEHTAVDGTVAGQRYLISQFSATQASLFAGSQIPGNFAWATKGAVIGEFNTNGGNVDGTLYGGDFTTAIYTNSNIGGNNLTQLTVGAQTNGGSSWWNGSLAEIVFVNAATTQVQRNAMRDYFNARYGMAIV